MDIESTKWLVRSLSTGKGRGGGLLYYWVEVFNYYCKKNIKLTNAGRQKVNFNSKISALKRFMDDDEIMALMHFVFVMNPQNLENMTDYGNLDNLINSSGYYLAWKNKNKVKGNPIEAVLKMRVTENDDSGLKMADYSEDFITEDD